MLYLNNADTIEGVNVYGDDKEFNKFYIIPDRVTYAVDDEGKPLFMFLKYKSPIDRKDGRKGGGHVVFSAEFTVSDVKLTAIKKVLQERVNVQAQKWGINPPPPVKIADVNYTEGTSTLSIGKDGVFVERVFDAGKPSLYGKNITSYSVELTQEGATLFEQALQGSGGYVVVTYQLKFEAKLPPVYARATWNASAFYSFVQKIDVEERVCSEDDYNETLSEINNRSESRDIYIDPGSSSVDPKVISELRATLTKSLDEAVERNLIKALPVENPEDARKWYQEEDIENVRKTVMRSQTASFTNTYREETIIQKSINPNKPLLNITNLKDKQGRPILWKDYARLIDLDDPFFKTLNVDVFINADFADLPINSVEVKLNYNGKPMNVMGNEADGEARFASPDDRARFASFVENDNWKYKYSYQVNYKGSSKFFQSKVMETDESQLTIGVDDVGILKVDLVPGDVNFEEVTQVQITMQYEDKDNAVKLIEQQFIMTEKTPVHRFQKIIFAERDKPYKYRCRYYMKNGKEFLSDWKEEMSNILNINDPFGGKKSVNVRSGADFETEVQTIFIDLKYRDETNKYEQATSVALSAQSKFFDWEFPVLNEDNGVVSYSGSIAYKGGGIEEIPETVTKTPTIMITASAPTTRKDTLGVVVSPVLLDFMDIKLVRVQLRYSDPTNKVLERKDIKFTETETDDQLWSIKIKDPAKREYEWSATFYMQDGTRRTVPLATSDALSIDLELPTA